MIRFLLWNFERLEMNATRECLQSRRLLWFGHLERIKESSLHIKYQTFAAYGSLAGEEPWKSWKEQDDIWKGGKSAGR